MRHTKHPKAKNPLTRKVLLIDWDAADRKVASELIDAGRMPNLQRVIEEEVMGNVSTPARVARRQPVLRRSAR